ncbi:hypothetical protein POTOM_041712 [Populus tomentosa]|uniref:Uncharacterized protein n=1 Tax=Populus tomentosa TaxID=118781 RepID=A0A8X7YZ15_POPTO|nr:hypothetical protein POTOM_041712 [Populus tomentosa]
MSNRGGFGALSAGSVPTPSPLRVDEGVFSRRPPTREPSVAVAASSVFAQLPPLVELLAALSWTVALAVTMVALEAMLMDDEFRGKLKLLEDCTATPNPDCGCSRGLNHLFCSYCYGNGSNHLIFVTRIK